MLRLVNHLGMGQAAPGMGQAAPAPEPEKRPVPPGKRKKETEHRAGKPVIAPGIMIDFSQFPGNA